MKLWEPFCHIVLWKLQIFFSRSVGNVNITASYAYSLLLVSGNETIPHTTCLWVISYLPCLEWCKCMTRLNLQQRWGKNDSDAKGSQQFIQVKKVLYCTSSGKLILWPQHLFSIIRTFLRITAFLSFVYASGYCFTLLAHWDSLLSWTHDSDFLFFAHEI